MNYPSNPRAALEKSVAARDFHALLRRAAELHGHFCSYLALGVRAACAALERMGVPANTGMEELMAVVECNNCFVDGIQAVSGCTFGNNALVFKDLGKTAVTFLKRGDGEGVRVAVKPSFDDPGDDPEAAEAAVFFERAVKLREHLTAAERRRMKELWTTLSFRVLDRPEEALFDIRRVEVAEPAFAPIFDAVVCARCGEKVMEPRTCVRDGRRVCLSCGGEGCWMVAGGGIRRAGEEE